MLHVVSIWLVVVSFMGAGIFNVIGTSGAESDFVRWGYPRWWNTLTGGLEIVTAGLVALPASRLFGLALGAMVVAAAVLTVLRHRDFKHIAPLGVFAALIALGLTS